MLRHPPSRLLPIIVDEFLRQNKKEAIILMSIVLQQFPQR